MTTEQEFFEAFEIEPKVEFKDSFGCWTRGTYYAYKNEAEGVKWRVATIITPEIVLKLLEILNREYNILIIECMSNSTKITASPAPDQDWGCDEAYYRVCVEEADLRTAILKVCSNYNVAMSIRDQVKELFND